MDHVHQLRDLLGDLLLHLILSIICGVLGFDYGLIQLNLNAIDIVDELSVLVLARLNVKSHKDAKEVNISLNPVLDTLIMFLDVLEGLDLLDIALNVDRGLGNCRDLGLEPMLQNFDAISEHQREDLLKLAKAEFGLRSKNIFDSN